MCYYSSIYLTCKWCVVQCAHFRCFQSTRRLEYMHIRAPKALTQSRKDMSQPAKQKSCDSEDVSMFTADSHHPHSPLEPSTLHPFCHPSSLPDGSFSILQLLIKHISMHLTLVELLCSVSFWMAPVSQFLIFRKRGHLEGLPFCRDLVGEVLLSARGCKSTNESLVHAFEQFATSGMHLVSAFWLAVMLRKAEKTISLSTEQSWINALIGCWLVVSLRSHRKQWYSATAVTARWTLVWVLLFSIIAKTLLQMATTLILFSQCCPFSYSYWLMNVCNFTSVLALEKGTVWLPKISVINRLRSSFIISSSICTAQWRGFWTTVAQSLAGWIPGIPSLIVISCLQIVGEEWLGLNNIWFCTWKGAKRSLSSCAALKGHLGSPKLRRKRQNKRREKKRLPFLLF